MSRKCHGMTKTGKPCRGGAMPGSQYCGPHQPKGKLSEIDLGLGENPSDVISWMRYIEDELTRPHSSGASSCKKDKTTG